MFLFELLEGGFCFLFLVVSFKVGDLVLEWSGDCWWMFRIFRYMLLGMRDFKLGVDSKN